MKAIFEVNEIVQGVQDGDLDPLKSFIELRRLEKGLKAAIATIQVEAIEKAADYGEKSFKAFDAEITCKNGAGRWDFKHIEPLKQLKSKVKDYEDLAKTAYKLIEKGKTVLDDDGVVVEPAMFTPGADTISIKL